MKYAAILMLVCPLGRFDGEAGEAATASQYPGTERIIIALAIYLTWKERNTPKDHPDKMT